MEEAQDKVLFMTKSTRNLVFGTLFVAILLTITAWAGSILTENAKREALADDVNALSASLKYPLLETMSLHSATGTARLKNLVVEVAKAGGYKSVTITDANGAVLATTGGALAAKSLDTKTLSRTGPKVERRKLGLWTAAPIVLGGDPIGYVLVQTDR